MSKAQIVRKYIIRSQMQTLAPLRIASGQEDGVTDILILKNRNNEAFIPGTSLAGVLRSRLEDIYGQEIAEQLFGKITEDENGAGEQSMLNISDIVLSGSEIVYRDGVAIDTFRGVGIDGAKYDFEMLDKGAKGQLYIELTVRAADLDKDMQLAYLHKNYEADGDIYGELAAAIADILTDGISVGSLTTKGFGRIASEKNVALVCFDFAKNGAFDTWIKYLETDALPKAVYQGNPINVSGAAAKTFKISAHFAVKSSLLVRDYAAAQERNDEAADGTKLSSVQMANDKEFIIPGTSIKGVLRNRAKKILTTLSGGSLHAADDYMNDLMGFADKNNAKKSRFAVEEVYIAKNKLQPHKHSRNRIDRFTGSTIDGALFTEEPVWQQQKDEKTVRLAFSIDKCKHDEAGLALLLLKDLWLGNLPIGGGKSIGRGTLRGLDCTISYEGNKYKINEANAFTVEGSKDTLEAYVSALVEEAQEMAVKE